MKKQYKEVVVSLFWMCTAIGMQEVADVNIDDVITSVKDTDCKAWGLQLRGVRISVPANLLPKEPDDLITVME